MSYSLITPGLRGLGTEPTLPQSQADCPQGTFYDPSGKCLSTPPDDGRNALSDAAETAILWGLPILGGIAGYKALPEHPVAGAAAGVVAGVGSLFILTLGLWIGMSLYDGASS